MPGHGLGGARAAPGPPPAHGKTSQMYKWVLAYPSAWGCLWPLSHMSARCWCLLNWYFPFSGHLVTQASAMSHSIYGLPAPVTWVIRIYVLIGVNTKRGVIAINSQALLRKILNRAGLSPAWLCTTAQGGVGRRVPLQPVCPSLGHCPDPNSHVSGPRGQGWQRLSWEVGRQHRAELQIKACLGVS